MSSTSDPTPAGPVSCVREHLSPASYTEFELFVHLQHIPKTNEDTTKALGEVFRRRGEITAVNLFSLDCDVMVESDDLSSCEVFEVMEGGAVLARHQQTGPGREDVLYSAAAWNMIKSVNLDNQAVGRITILRQPCPATFASIHFTMRHHFDMDELFSQLVSSGAKKRRTVSNMSLRAFDPTHINQRSFLFVLKYYTLVDEDHTPAPWQLHDGNEIDPTKTDHLNISEGSSVVALSLGGAPVAAVSPQRRQSKALKMGTLYDTFAPFHVLNMQCFPDDVRSDPGFAEHSLYSGPQAFLECLAAEFKMAFTRLLRLTDKIEGMCIPSQSQFIFDRKLRDKLLFEDPEFTLTRRYFWAHSTLTVVNDSIRSMISEYHSNFNREFWAGKHPTLWPHPDPDTTEGRNYLSRLAGIRHELDWSISRLKALIKSNEKLKQEIDNFTEQLYRGSAVRENRVVVEQGENIKILTAVSMLFHPLTFVTGIFGMELINIAPTDWRFSVMMVSVCIPFFIVIFVIQTHAGMSLVKRVSRAIKHGWQRRARNRREKRTHMQHAAMIRRQSCASSVNLERRESMWHLMTDRKARRRGNSPTEEERWGKWRTNWQAPQNKTSV